MKRTILIALDVDDVAPDGSTYTTEDIADSLRARLDEIPGLGCAVPEDVRLAVTNPDAVRTFLQAAEVGLDGATDAGVDDLDAEHAWQTLQDLGGPVPVG